MPLGLISLVVLWRLLPAIRRPDATRSIDYVGAAVFAAAITPFLVGPTNKQSGEWTDPAVGGLMLVGLAFGALFLWIESRVADPIVPLGPFRVRSFHHLRRGDIPRGVRVLRRVLGRHRRRRRCGRLRGLPAGDPDALDLLAPA